MRKENERRESRGRKPIPCPTSPKSSEGKAGEANGEVVVEKTHAEGIAVGEHGETWKEEPRDAFRYRGNETENTPEENQDARRDGENLCSVPAEESCRLFECDVEQNVVPLAGDIDAGSLTMLGQLGEPGVVHVAAQISGLNVGVPDAWNEQEKRENRDDGKIAPQEVDGSFDGERLDRFFGKVGLHRHEKRRHILHG